MLNTKIKFDSRYDDEEYGTTTLYFIAPREMLCGKYSKAEFTAISIEFPSNHIEAHYASVMFSPRKYFEENDCYIDYDWFDINMSYEDIETLIKIAERFKEEY